MAKINANAVVLLNGINLQQYTSNADIIENSVSPTPSDDGYPIGKVWINTTSGEYFALVNNAAENAVWLNLSPLEAVDPIITTTSPTSTNWDYPLGQVWINTVGNFYFVLYQNSAETGLWLQLATTAALDILSVKTLVIQSLNDPVATDWEYPIGKTWLNTISGGYFILRDNAEDNAIWEKINGTTAINTNAITKTVATLSAGVFVSASDTDAEEVVLASNSGNYNVLGYIEGTGSVSGEVQVFTQGNIVVEGASWTVADIGKSVWLGTDGGWSLDYPVVAGNRRVYLGKIVSPTQISLELNLINEEIQ